MFFQSTYLLDFMRKIFTPLINNVGINNERNNVHETNDKGELK